VYFGRESKGSRNVDKMRYSYPPALAGLTFFLYGLTTTLAQNFSTDSAPGPQGLPKVDLGYEVHQAISFNVCQHI
jgi:hypothetical protein